MATYSVYVDDLLKLILRHLDTKGLTGNFENEVSAEFGKWFSDQLIKHQLLPLREDSQKWIKNKMFDFFKLGLSSEREIDDLGIAIGLSESNVTLMRKNNISVKGYWADDEHFCFVTGKDSQELSTKTIVDYPINKYINPSINGNYTGKILGISDGIVIQKLGDNNKFVLHNLLALSDDNLSEGVSAEIQYNKGKGRVTLKFNR